MSDIEKPKRATGEPERYEYMSIEQSQLFDRAAAGEVPQDQANHLICQLLLKIAAGSRADHRSSKY